MATLDISTNNNTKSIGNDAATTWDDQVATGSKGACVSLSYLVGAREVRRFKGDKSSVALVQRAASRPVRSYLLGVRSAVKARFNESSKGWSDLEMTRELKRISSATAPGDNTCISVDRRNDETGRFHDCFHLNFAGHTAHFQQRESVWDCQIQDTVNAVQRELDAASGVAACNRRLGKIYAGTKLYVQSQGKDQHLIMDDYENTGKILFFPVSK
ncbi:hypothetical protein I302_108636 [Kwoniella bestiolae CBS 10118]|uniref:Uncharacterized protein n=1 Tax=Kwoniella bestiolae CBS 10118 TaxID=1296100 RepID=A0A1B9FTP1_9TREE|nr:hypothetical protein I302_07773 [Kwoniella bestiolae CBS 10118]OCF22131.1 hypothetical protein I302_07773 [Kwoniella bestiolae CBS 10118]